MSAPLAVNTVDGTVWTRREGTRGGEALYAPEKCGTCPAFVMVTMTELAELGIEGSADVLPMPAGPVRDVEDELTGARLALFEEEQETAALREERHSTNEALDDAIRALRTAQERIAVLEAREEIVARFVANRAEYITSIRNCHPNNGHDYDRWQGHAAARRQLAQELGLPVAWPLEDSAAVERSAAKLAGVLAPSEGEHYAFVHHDHRLGHDLPELGGAM